MAFTGKGPVVRKLTIPITSLDRHKTIRKLLLHLNIALQSIQDLKAVKNVRCKTRKVSEQRQAFSYPALNKNTLNCCDAFFFLQAQGQISVRSLALVHNLSVDEVSNSRKLITRCRVAFVAIQIDNGSVDMGILGQNFQIPLKYISSNDKKSVNQLIKQMGKRLGQMLEAANIPKQNVVLRTIFTKRDSSYISVDTPLGHTENVEQVLSNLTLWDLVPEEAQHEGIQHVRMSIEVSFSSVGSVLLACAFKAEILVIAFHLVLFRRSEAYPIPFNGTYPEQPP